MGWSEEDEYQHKERQRALYMNTVALLDKVRYKMEASEFWKQKTQLERNAYFFALYDVYLECMPMDMRAEINVGGHDG